MKRRPKAADGTVGRTACARVLIRGGVDEAAGEVLTAGELASRVSWCAALVSGMASALLAAHWNAPDVGALASGTDAAGRPLPASAWMALRRLGWAASVAEGVTVSDRIVRMAQEQAGRALRSARWQADLTGAVLAAWPAGPLKRTRQEWDAARSAMPGGEHVPSSVFRARTRQVRRFLNAKGRLPRGPVRAAGPAVGGPDAAVVRL